MSHSRRFDNNFEAELSSTTRRRSLFPGMQDPRLIAYPWSPVWEAAAAQDARCEQARGDVEIDLGEFTLRLEVAAENGDTEAKQWLERLTGEPFVPIRQMPGVFLSPDVFFTPEDF